MHDKPPSGEYWDAYKTLTNLTSMGLSVWLPEGTPDAAFEAIKAGWEALKTDPEFAVAHEKSFGKPVGFVTFEQAQAAQASVANVSPDMVKFFQDYIAKGEQ